MKAMSLPVVVGIVSALLVNTLWSGAATAAAPSNSRQLASADETPAGLTTTDWSSIRKLYDTDRHAVFPRSHGGLAARNPGQQWLAHFDGRGFTVTPDTGGWSWGLELRCYGFPGAEQDLTGTAKVAHQGGGLHYDWNADLREWFVNDRRGLEQGWTIRQRPPGAREGEPLRLELFVRGDLQPSLTADDTRVGFLDAAGSRVLDFGGLKAWDVDGTALAARFEVAKTAGNRPALKVTIAEQGARYPITIDPIAQQAYLKASNTGSDDRFGWSVAISGDTVVVAAPREDSNATGVDGNQGDNSAADSGAAYVFVRSGTIWSQQAYLKASNTGAGDGFGTAIAISGDTVVVGTHDEASNATGVNGNQGDNSAERAGAAYVFVRNGTTWSQQAYLKASNTEAHDWFGHSVAASGETVAVGARGEGSGTTGVNGDQADNSANYSGAAYVFVRSGTTWTQQAYLKASNTDADDEFGRSIAISGNTVVVGAYYEAGGATGVNGNQADNSADYSGAAYVFARAGTTWSQQAYLKASNTDYDDNFGTSVAISGDTVVVGALSEDSNATGVDGNQGDNSADGSGAAYVFSRSGTAWTQQAYLKASNSDAGDSFGASVAISGIRVVVGADGEDGNSTGIDGNHADNSASGAGAVYLFMSDGLSWTQDAYLKASNTDAGDRFGDAVAVSSDTVIVGANWEASNATSVNGNHADNSAPGAGAAYTFGAPPLPAEIVVEQTESGVLADGGTVDLPGVPVNDTNSLGFTIRNIGEENLTGLTITRVGADAALFTVTTSPVAPLPPGGSTPFEIEFAPTTAGIKTAALLIASNDADENPFDINLTGRTLSQEEDSDGDGINDVAEYRMSALGFDWTLDQPALVDALLDNAGLCGLFTENEIRNLHAGTPLIEVSGGTVTLELQLRKSDDLVIWEDLGDPVQWTEAAAEKAFYRLFFTEP